MPQAMATIRICPDDSSRGSFARRLSRWNCPIRYSRRRARSAGVYTEAISASSRFSITVRWRRGVEDLSINVMDVRLCSRHSL